MGQGTSKNAGQSSRGGVESHSSGRGSNTKRITRLRKLLQLRIPGLSRGKEKHRPPASYYHKDVSTSLASSLELVHRAAVSRPSSFQPLHPSEYDWTMDDIDTHTFDENEYSLHEETDNMMEMDPINNFFTIPPKNDIGPQRTSRKYRDDTLFPRYPERTPAARRKMNFERFKQLHAHAPPDTEYYLFLGITTVATTSIDRLGEAKGKISPDRTTISLGVAEILQESSLILTDAHVPHGPVSASVDRSRTPELTPPRLSPVPEEETPVPPGNQPSPSPIIIPEAFTSATLFQPNHDVVVETIGPSIHASECSQIVSSIAAPYLRFARSRSTTSKKNMRSTWQKVTYLLTPNEPPSRSTNDEEYLSVKHLLALTRQAYPFNIVLYLKRLAIQWHLHDIARQYFDPFIPPYPVD